MNVDAACEMRLCHVALRRKESIVGAGELFTALHCSGEAGNVCGAAMRWTRRSVGKYFACICFVRSPSECCFAYYSGTGLVRDSPISLYQSMHAHTLNISLSLISLAST